MKKSLLASAVILASVQIASMNALADNHENSDPVGKCFGVVGAHEGECGGKNPATGESWSCHGNNPTADFGWKKMKKSQCEAATKHKDAKEKKFVANK